MSSDPAGVVKNDRGTMAGGKTRRRLAAQLAVATLVVCMAAAPSRGAAAAAEARSPRPAEILTGSDATGDTARATDCHPDITAWGGDYTDQRITLHAEAACGSDPYTDPEWLYGVTGVVWGIDLNGDGAEEYDVVFVNNDGNVIARVLRASDSQVACTGGPNVENTNRYSVTFEPSCIGDPFSFSMAVYMEWDETAGEGTCACPYDFAPDTGFSVDIARSSTPPPNTGFGTACNASDLLPDQFADAGLAADCLKAYAIALGKADGTFGEHDPLRRSQVSSLLARLLTTNGIALTNHRSFPDVNPDTVPNAQVRDEIEELAGAGIIAGFPDGTFGPAGTLSVAQASTFVIRTIAVMHSHLPTAPDLHDQGSTTLNWHYAIAEGILDTHAMDLHGAIYTSGRGDATERGLLADMLAQLLERMGKFFLIDCDAAASIGATPLHLGDPGYRPPLDPDGDGTACDAPTTQDFGISTRLVNTRSTMP